MAFPTSLEKAQMLGSTLSEYTDDHYYAVLLAHGFVYIYLQTFAIPGTVFANLLAGALFGMYVFACMWNEIACTAEWDVVPVFLSYHTTYSYACRHVVLVRCLALDW